MRRTVLTRQEIFNVLREFVFEHGPQVTLRQFVAQTSIPESQIRKHFGSWMGLRKEHGWIGDERDYRRITDDDLWNAYHELVQKLGRFPKQNEIDKRAPYSSRTYFVRFGSQPILKTKYQLWVKRQEKAAAAEGEEETADGSAPKRAADLGWLREQCQKLQVTYELRSSDFRAKAGWQWDLLVVLEHDWPACPIKVLELSELLPQYKDVQPAAAENLQAETLSDEMTRAELYGPMPWES